MNAHRPGRTRCGFSLTEALIVVGIVAVLFGLLLPAIQTVREAANRSLCANNLRQQLIASVNYNLVNGRLTPGKGSFPPGYWPLPSNQPLPQAVGIGWFHLLPFLEEELLYRRAAGVVGNSPGCANAMYAGLLWPGFNSVFSTPLKILQCPSDPSNPPTGVAEDSVIATLSGSTSLDAAGGSGYFTYWGTSCYAGNSQVYDRVDRNPADGGPGGYPPTAANAATGPLFVLGSDSFHLGFGYYEWNPDGAAQIPNSFPDGLSTTILIAEKYARCTNAIFGPPANSGGNYWAFDGEIVAPSLEMSRFVGFTAGTNTGYLPGTPAYGGFAFAAFDQPPSPLSSNMISIGPASKPLFRPQPFVGPGSQCDPRLASTAHATMQVGMADGSVHSVSPGVSGATWWAALTPSGHDQLGDDW